MTASAKVISIPDHEPEDHKPKKKNLAVTPREAEAADGFVTIEHCGITLRIPVGGKIPITAVDAFRAGDNYEGTKLMIGEKQWKLLSDAGMTMDDLDELGKKLREASGN